MRGEENPKRTGEEGLGALFVCEAVKEATEMGAIIDVEEIYKSFG